MAYQRYYSSLGISPTSGKEEVKRAYRQLAKQYHPDLNPEPGAQDRFLEVSAAYDKIMQRLNRPKRYKYMRNTAAVKQKLKKSRRDETAEDRAARYAKMRYKMYKQESDAHTEFETLWKYKFYYYFILIVVSVVSIFTLGACIYAMDSFNDIGLIVVIIAICIIFIRLKNLFFAWNKDFSHRFKDQI